MSGRTGSAVNPARRSLLFGRVHARPTSCRPPWTVEADLLERCRRCDACVQACPEGIIVRGDGGFPEVDFAAGACTFCRACAEACPEPALFAAPMRQPWSLAPILGGGCLNAAGVVCRSCGDSCPERVIRFRPAPGGVAHLHFSAEHCTGCGACVAACPADSITLRQA